MGASIDTFSRADENPLSQEGLWAKPSYVGVACKLHQVEDK